MPETKKTFIHMKKGQTIYLEPSDKEIIKVGISAESSECGKSTTIEVDVAKREQELFAEGLIIEYEFSTNDGGRVRVVQTAEGKRYRFKYERNEHNVLIIFAIDEIS